jgi:hypothetical protein
LTVGARSTGTGGAFSRLDAARRFVVSTKPPQTLQLLRRNQIGLLPDSAHPSAPVGDA